MTSTLIVGGLTIDRFADGTVAPGGSVLHSGPAAAGEGADLDKKGAWLWAGVDDKVLIQREAPLVEKPPLPPEPKLAWLDDITAGSSDGRLVAALRQPPPRFTRSATELRSFFREREHWVGVGVATDY